MTSHDQEDHRKTEQNSNIQDQVKSKYTRYHTANRTVCPGWQQARRLRLEGWTQEKIMEGPEGKDWRQAP